MQKTVIYYNENEVIEGKGSKEDIINGYNIWIDLINPTPSDFYWKNHFMLITK